MKKSPVSWSKIGISSYLNDVSRRGIVNLINFDEMMKFNRSFGRIDANPRLFAGQRRFRSREACRLSTKRSKRIDDFTQV